MSLNVGTSFSLPMKPVSLGFAEPVVSSSSLGIASKIACNFKINFLLYLKQSKRDALLKFCRALLFVLSGSGWPYQVANSNDKCGESCGIIASDSFYNEIHLANDPSFKSF